MQYSESAMFFKRSFSKYELKLARVFTIIVFVAVSLLTVYFKLTGRLNRIQIANSLSWKELVDILPDILLVALVVAFIFYLSYLREESKDERDDG
jgi:predicted membrane protein